VFHKNTRGELETINEGIKRTDEGGMERMWGEKTGAVLVE